MHLVAAIDLIRKRWPSVQSSATEEPVFLLAAGWRSGSTMLQRMLLKHCLVWGEPYGSSGLIEHLTRPFGRFMPNWPKEEFFLDPRDREDQLSEQWTANLYPPVQNLLDAHVEFFRKLFGEPSRQHGYSRWGLKEVRYGIEHAVYLRWLFPRGKILFLVRNPYVSWASYRRGNFNVLRFWPDEPIATPEQFGSHWVNLAQGFQSRCKEVGGFLIQYERLIEADFDLGPLEDYLGFAVDRSARKIFVGASPPGSVPHAEMERLRQVVSPLADALGYDPSN